MVSLTRFVEAIGAREELPSSPVIIAAEAAKAAVFFDMVETPKTPSDIGLEAIKFLPPNATSFERGLAVGMAIVLAARSTHEAAHIS